MLIHMKPMNGNCRKADPASRRRSILSTASLNLRVAAPSDATPDMDCIRRARGLPMFRTPCRID